MTDKQRTNRDKNSTAIEAHAQSGFVTRLVLRQAEALGRDAAQHPHARLGHLTYLTGAIGLAVTLGYLSDEQGIRLRAACGEKLMETSPPPWTPTEAAGLAYVRLLLAVLRHGGASLQAPVEMALMGPAKARQMLTRMQRDGLLHDANLWGFHAIRAGEA
ncbi:hypothetical protein [Dyella sp. 2RAB6]|uniref:hypothetical protein n=1 Tax=Dyella sp. 2RAB6 TaxID=3232992 RepID=UPI003F92CC97